MRPLGVATLVVCAIVLAGCLPVTAPPPPPPPPPPAPPPPPPPPPPGSMSLGWSVPGVNGPVAADVADNAVWAMNKGAGILYELDANTGAVILPTHSVPLDGAQHFPTPEVAGGWAIIERSNNQVVGFKTDHTSSWTSPTLDGLVQARPLVVGSIVIVATENDSLYGLNLADGTFAWSTTNHNVNIGTPEPLSDAHQFPGLISFCGDIDPLGITSNPVADGGSVYAVGEVTGPHPAQAQHLLVGVDPTNGTVTLSPKNIDVASMSNPPPNANVAAEQQRAGLLAANGNIYIGFGGLAGDCGVYHGYVVAAKETDGSVVGSFEAAAISNAAAVWGTSGPVSDSSGNVYATTGNSQGTPPNNSTPDYSDGVVRLAPTMSGATTAPADYFQPPAWRSDNASDLDLGSTGPVLLPSRNEIFVLGKQNIAFLLNTSSLGTSDHMTPAASLAMCNAKAFGQNTAIGNSSIYVACLSGIQQVKIN